jgi:Na+/melibiose symporter-like transporter
MDFAMCFGLITCLLSMSTAILLVWLDGKWYQRPNNSVMGTYEEIRDSEDGLQDFELDYMGKEEHLFVSNFDVLDQRPSKTSDWKGFFRFDVRFWILCLSLFLVYGTVVPFNTIHAGFLQKKWYHDDPQTSSQVMAVPDILSAILVPLVGAYVDRFGHRIKILIVCGFMICSSHFFLASGQPPKYIPSPVPFLLVLGLAYSMLFTYWSCIPILVSTYNLASGL